jgi:hypothetical protein
VSTRNTSGRTMIPKASRKPLRIHDHTTADFHSLSSVVFTARGGRFVISGNCKDGHRSECPDAAFGVKWKLGKFDERSEFAFKSGPDDTEYTKHLCENRAQQPSQLSSREMTCWWIVIVITAEEPPRMRDAFPQLRVYEHSPSPLPHR